MDGKKCWRIRFEHIDSLHEKWNLDFKDILCHVDTQRRMRHEFIVVEQRSGYCKWIMLHPTMGATGYCTVWTENPDEAKLMERLLPANKLPTTDTPDNP